MVATGGYRSRLSHTGPSEESVPASSYSRSKGKNARFNNLVRRAEQAQTGLRKGSQRPEVSQHASLTSRPPAFGLDSSRPPTSDELTPSTFAYRSASPQASNTYSSRHTSSSVNIQLPPWLAETCGDLYPLQYLGAPPFNSTIESDAYSSPTAVAGFDGDMRSDDVWTSRPESSSVVASPLLKGTYLNSALQLHHPTPVKHSESTSFLDDNPSRYVSSSPFHPELQSPTAYEHAIRRRNSSAGSRVLQYSGSGTGDDSQLQTFHARPPSSPRYISINAGATDDFEYSEQYPTNTSVRSTPIAGSNPDFNLNFHSHSNHAKWSEDVPISSPGGMEIAPPLSQRYSFNQSRHLLDDRNDLAVGGSSHSSPSSPNFCRPRNDAVSDALLYMEHSFIPPQLLATSLDMELDFPPRLPERVTTERSLMNDSPLHVGDKSLNSHPSLHPLPSWATNPVAYTSPGAPVTPNDHFHRGKGPRDPYEESLKRHAASEAYPPIPALNFDLLLRNRTHQNHTRLVFEETWSSRTKPAFPSTAAHVECRDSGSEIPDGMDTDEPKEAQAEGVQPSDVLEFDARVPRAPVTPPYKPNSLSQKNLARLPDLDMSPSKVYRTPESSKILGNEFHPAGFSMANTALPPVTPTRSTTFPNRVSEPSRDRQSCSPRGWVHPESNAKHHDTISAPLALQAQAVGLPQRPRHSPEPSSSTAIQTDANRENPVDPVNQDLLLPEEDVDELCDSLIKDNEEDISSSESSDDGWEQLERDGGDAYNVHEHLPARAVPDTGPGRHERTKASGTGSCGNHMVVDVTDDECGSRNGSPASSHDSIESWSNEDVLAFLKGELER